VYRKTESMKASEPRIGNWVKVPTTDGSDVFTQIEPSNFCHDCNAGISIESYCPIPLTEEWLVKFGFEFFCKLQDTTAYCIGKLNNFIIVPTSGKWEIRYRVDERFSRYLSIEFVHQLQNLYQVLTGEELTLKEKP
jgi:hypothetical protein